MRLAAAGLLIAIVGIGVYLISSNSLSPRTSPFPPARAGQGDEPADATGFAADRIEPIVIDGKRYMSYLRAVCDLGPRISGTTGMKKQQDLIIAHFDKLGLKTTKQTFQAKQVTRPNEVEMTNLIVSIFPEKKKRVILCSHYDTRPLASEEEDPRKQREPFVSANDGGSGVALMMELAHHLPKLTPDVGVDLVFFDGEEFIFDRDKDKYFFGSEHFAKTWKKAENRSDYIGAVLFDMIAGKFARFPAEGHSYVQAPRLNNEIWGLARDLKCGAFAQQVGQRVMDDHLALLDAGIPAIDIIDFDYTHWHRLSDTPDNCHPDGPTQVAKVVSVWIQRAR